MKNNYLALAGFGVVLVIMISATGNYLYAVGADFFFLAAYSLVRTKNTTNSVT